MPFWRAVLGYEYRADSPDEDRLVSDRFAPGWWTLADPEGNEVDVATWMDHG